MKHKRLESFKKIVLTVVVAIGLSPQSVLSQAKYVREVSNDKAYKVDFSSNFSTLKSAYANSVIYYASQYPKEKKVEFYTYNIVTHESGLLKIENPKSAKILLSERIESFAVNNNKIVVISSDHIIVFEMTSKKSIRCEGITKNQYLLKKCLPLGNNFLMYVNYNYHPKDAPNKHVWATFDAEKREIVNLKFQSEENSIFGSLVNTWIDTHGSKIVYADPLNYSITFYNEKFEPTDSIRLDELENNEVHVSPFRKMNLNSKEAISNLMAADDSLLTRIRKIYYLNDSTVMALLIRPEKEAVRVDLWQKQNGNWIRTNQDYSAPWFDEGGSYSKDSLTYTDFYQNVYDVPYVGDYKFVEAYFPYIPTVTTSNFNRNNDYYKLQNDAIQKEEIYFGVKLFQLTFPNL